MKVIKRKASVAKMAGVATVDGVVVAEAEVMCKLADKDESRRRSRPRRRCRFIPQRSSIRAARIARNAPKSALTAIVGAEVEIGARTRLMAHVYLEGPTWIGEDNIFFPYSAPSAWPRRI